MPIPAPPISKPHHPSLIASPCTDVCRVDERSGWCEGCMRSLDEIAAWQTMNDLAKRAVWKQLPQRRAQLNAARLDR